MKKYLIATALCLPLAGMPLLAGAADGFRVSIGADYTSGDYGGSDTTNILSVPLSLGYSRGRLGLKVTIPWIQVTGRGDVIPGVTTPVIDDNRRGALKEEDDIIASGGTPTTVTRRTTESGLGDVTAAASYALIDQPDGLRLSVTGKVKFPTADEKKNLGSGETDYTAQIDVDRPFGRLTPFVTVGYRWLGDNSEFELRNVLFATVGAAFKFTDYTSVDVSYDWGQAASRDGTPIGEVTLGLSHWLGDHWKLSAYVLKGVTDGSPDWGGGATVGYAF